MEKQPLYSNRTETNLKFFETDIFESNISDETLYSFKPLNLLIIICFLILMGSWIHARIQLKRVNYPMCHKFWNKLKVHRYWIHHRNIMHLWNNYSFSWDFNKNFCNCSKTFSINDTFIRYWSSSMSIPASTSD